MRLAFVAVLLLAAPLAFAAAPAAVAAAEAQGACGLRETAIVNVGDLISGSCPGIRPGAEITSPVGQCTMAWILRDASGALYGTTAGHCGAVGQRVSLASLGAQVGTFVFSVDQPIGEDFAVFKIDSSRAGIVSPDMCAWGGATGVYAGAGPAAPGVVRHFGFGVGTGTLAYTRARSGAMDYATATTFGFAGAVAPGDSGSPARLASGEALGVITDLLAPRSPGTGPLVPADLTFMTQAALGTRLDHGIAEAEAATGLSFTLVTGTPANEP